MEPYFDLGNHSFLVTTSSQEAQIWFDRGLSWTFGFNQEEGLACFEKALKSDPDCAMACWGVAYAAGPFYNMPWVDFSPEESTECTDFCYRHIQQAVKNSHRVTPVEKALIHALAARIQKDHPVSQAEFDRWDDDYADAMRGVWEAFPKNHDVAALFAEAMMTRTPWKLWDTSTNLPPQGASTYEALQVIETAIHQAEDLGAPQHPAILHLHIHATEMSATPECALQSADRLGVMCPEAGHINHMPAHTYALCGLFGKAKVASEKAIVADRKYLAYAGPYNFYTTARCHDLLMMMHSCMMMGQYEASLAAANEIAANLTPDVVRQNGKPYLETTMEGYRSMVIHVLVRFGKWQEIAKSQAPADKELYPVTTAMHHYAQTVAFAALSQFDQAKFTRDQFYETVSNIPRNRKFFNNPAPDILAVGESMLLGELDYHQGKYDRAFGHLRQAVARNDALAYSEPWPWMHPPRHALGALLLAQGHHQEAQHVYRTDLGLNDKLQRCAQNRNNLWALHGLAECLQHGDDKTEVRQILAARDTAMASSDFAVMSSCCCRK